MAITTSDDGTEAADGLGQGVHVVDDEAPSDEAPADDAADQEEAGGGEDDSILEEIYQGEDDLTRRLVKRLSAKSSGVHMIDKEILVSGLRQRVREQSAFCSLPFSIVFFLVFVECVLQHENMTNAGLVQREMRSMLEGTTFEGVQYTSGHKDIGDIDTWPDVYLYIQEVVLPLFLNPVGTSARERYRVLRYNQIVGGVQMQQVRRQKKLCAEVYPDLGPFEGDINPMLASFFCYPWYTRTSECYGPAGVDLPMGFCPDGIEPRLQYGYDGNSTRRLSGYSGPNASTPLLSEHESPSRSRRLDGRGADSRRLAFVPDGSGTGDGKKGRGAVSLDEQYSVLLHEFEGLEAAHDHVHELQTNGWIDYNTAWLGISLLVFNPDLGIYVHVMVNIYFAVSGALLPHVTAQAFNPQPYRRMASYVIDGLFLLCFVYIIIKQAALLRRAMRRKTYKSWILHNAWDVLIILAGIALLILWYFLLLKIGNLKDRCMDMRLAEPTATETHPEYDRYVWLLHQDADALSGYLEDWRLVLFFYTLLCAGRFLGAFDAQPRLAVVTKTISQGANDLFHFLIVMVIVFASFTVAGHFLFGRRIWDFSTPVRSAITCARIFLGDFDWDDLSEDYTQTARLWFFLYISLMTLLMLNMVMAIIMEQYTETKSDASETRPIWTQVFSMCVEYYQLHKGYIVSDSDIIDALETLPDGTNVDRHVLRTCIGPQLSDAQIDSLIAECEAKEDQVINKGVNIAEAMKMVGWVKIAVEKIGWKLDEILQQERDERVLLEGKTVDETGETDEGITEDNTLLGDPGRRIMSIESRMDKVEDFLHQAMEYAVFRGNDLRNRLAVIEDLIRSQRDSQQQLFERGFWTAKAQAASSSSRRPR